MGLEANNGIGKFQEILDFMGYKTIQTVAKLQQPRQLDRFIIESSKLKTNMRFHEKFKEMNLDFCHGDILVLKDIANAAASFAASDNCDKIDIQKNVHEKCVKVSWSNTIAWWTLLFFS